MKKIVLYIIGCGVLICFTITAQSPIDSGTVANIAASDKETESTIADAINQVEDAEVKLLLKLSPDQLSANIAICQAILLYKARQDRTPSSESDVITRIKARAMAEEYSRNQTKTASMEEGSLEDGKKYNYEYGIGEKHGGEWKDERDGQRKLLEAKDIIEYYEWWLSGSSPEAKLDRESYKAGVDEITKGAFPWPSPPSTK